MDNVVNLIPTFEDKVQELIDDSEQLLVIGITETEMKVVSSSPDKGNMMLMLEAAKREVVATYLDELVDNFNEKI